MKFRPALLPALLASLAGSAFLPSFARASEPTTSITIYSSSQPGAIDPSMYRPGGRSSYGVQRGANIPGFAVVRDDRRLTIPAGRGEVALDDVAALLDPTTVSFQSLTDASGTRVLEQNFQFDLVSQERLYERFIDQRITVIAPRGQSTELIDGTLLSAQGGVLVLRTALNEVITAPSNYGVQLPSLPGGLRTKPTLLWTTQSDRGGEQTARVTYQTEGVAWWSDYNLIFTEGANANVGTLDVSAWVSILNQSGATYDNARLKLVAGEVQRARPPRFRRAEMMYEVAARADMNEPQFSEKSFFEYHLYTLSTPTTLPDNSTKQIELFEAVRGVPCEKVLVYAGQQQGQWYGGSGPLSDQNFGVQSGSSVDVYLRFENADKHGMGMPLPAGRIRVSKLDDADGGLEFIGEDVIRHTPRNEKVLVRLGNAFDVVGERKQVDFKHDERRRFIEETIEIEVRNRKREAVRVLVRESMYRWTNWQLMGEAPAHEKLDSTTLHFPLEIAADGTGKVRYVVRYSW